MWKPDAGSIKQSISGLDWVAGHVKKPAVVVLSLGVLDNDLSRSLDQVCRLAPTLHMHATTIRSAESFMKQILVYNQYPCPKEVWEELRLHLLHVTKRFTVLSTVALVP